MSKGMEIRAQIDQDMVRALLLLNGGASVAMLAFLPYSIANPDLVPLIRGILWGLLFYLVGLVTAVVHIRLRRLCSLEYENHGYSPPPGTFIGVRLKEPRVCFVSVKFMWLSLLAFVFGSFRILLGGFCSLG